MYEELQQEIAEIKTRNFHQVERKEAGVPSGVADQPGVEMPRSYRVFISMFGWAKLYRKRDYYQLGVLNPPQELTSKDGAELLCIGHFRSNRAFFRLSLLAPGKESPVLEEMGDGLAKVAESFESWILRRCAECRQSYTKGEWNRVLKGPKPFTEAELAIVSARRLFDWSLIGFAENGDAEVLVKNRSELTLPYLTLGARARDNSIGGRIWLKVADISPGQERVVIHPCYNGQIARDNLDLFSLSDPGPEEREIYWEFKDA